MILTAVCQKPAVQIQADVVQNKAPSLQNSTQSGNMASDIAGQCLTGATLVASLLYGYSKWASPIPITGLTLCCCIVCGVFYDIVFQNMLFSFNGRLYRGSCGLGLSYTFLVPVAFLSAQFQHQTNNPVVDHTVIALSLVPILGQLFIAHSSQVPRFHVSKKSLLLAGMIPWLLVLMFLVSEACSVHDPALIRPPYFYITVGGVLLWLAIYSAPESFTLSEATILMQGVVLFVIFASRTIVTAFDIHWEFLNTFKTIDSRQNILLGDFTIVAGLSTLLCIVVLFIMKMFRSTRMFYVLLLLVGGGFAYPLFHALSGEDFVSWMAKYIYFQRSKMYLFVHWLVICIISVLTVVVMLYRNFRENQEITGDSHSKHDEPPQEGPDLEKHEHSTCHNRKKSNFCPNVAATDNVQKQRSHYVTTGERKLFHMIALIAFVPGVYVDYLILKCASSCILIIFVMLEVARILGIQPFARVLESSVPFFRDKQDQGILILTPLYLLIGCSIPLWLFKPTVTPTVSMFSGVLSLCIGDTMASVVGSRYGSWKWPCSTDKSIQGTGAAVISQVLCFIPLLYFDYLTCNQLLPFSIAVFLTSLLEALTYQIDNLVLPLFMFILFNMLL